MRDDLIHYLNRAGVRANIDALKNIDTPVTADNLLNFFHDPNVQFAALYFTALRDAEKIDGSSLLKDLVPDQKRACLYVGYQHRKVFNEVISHPGTARSIADLAPAQRAFFHANERIYGKYGVHSPWQVMDQVAKAAQPLLVIYLPAPPPLARTPVPQRPARHPGPSRSRTKKHARS